MAGAVWNLMSKFVGACCIFVSIQACLAKYIAVISDLNLTFDYFQSDLR